MRKAAKLCRVNILMRTSCSVRCLLNSAQRRAVLRNTCRTINYHSPGRDAASITSSGMVCKGSSILPDWLRLVYETGGGHELRISIQSEGSQDETKSALMLGLFAWHFAPWIVGCTDFRTEPESLSVDFDPVEEYTAMSDVPINALYRELDARVRTVMAWKSADAKRYVSNMIKKLALKCGYPWSCVDAGWLPAYTLRLPELVVCPQEFDFPKSEKPGRHYIEPTIDLDRVEEAFHWDLLDDTRPLVYCALGTLTCFPKQSYQSFYQAVIDASKVRPDWEWVLAVGSSLRVGAFRVIPSNVIVVNRAPQLALLSRAAMMITHGGTNTIKECVYFGVPMVVYPLGYDHPGNATRVIYRGLG